MYFSFVEQIKKQNEKQNKLHNETKDLTFQVSNFSITFFLKIIFYEGGGLGIYHVFMDSIDFKQ